MAVRFLAVVLGLSFLLIAAKKESPGMARGENEDLILNVTLYDNPADVKELLGTDLEGHYIVADVRVEPKYGKDIIIDHNDFVLQTFKDGEKSTPFEPNQVAGKDAITLTHAPSKGAASPGMVMAGPIVLHGGALGGGKDQAGKDQAGDGAGKVTEPSGAPDTDNPLKKLLAEKILPEKKTDQPAAGLLYFPMEKQKRKDLELKYGGRENRITLVFK
jgi:hypothetical protein